MKSILRLWGPYLLDRIGLIGGAGIVLVVAALVGQLVLVDPMQSGNQALKARLARIGKDGAPNPAQAPGFAMPGGAEPADKVPDSISHLFAAAQEAGLTLHNGSYRLVHGKDEGLGQYQVVLPIEGPYPSVRDFLNKALVQPALALDSLKLSRDSVEDSTVKAEVHLTLFLEGKP
jgi:hypothetical protein